MHGAFSQKMERKLETNHHLVLFLKSYHYTNKLSQNSSWNGFSLHLCPSSAAKVGRALSDFPYPVHLSELDGAARWTSNTEQGDRDFAIPLSHKKCPTSRGTYLRHNFPHCHYSHLFTENGWVRTDEDKRKTKSRAAQNETGFHVTIEYSLSMVQKLFCVTTFGVSFLQLQLRKYATEPENMVGSQQGLALHLRVLWHWADSRLCLTTNDIHYHSLDTKNTSLVTVILLPFKSIYVLGWFPSKLADKL